MKFFRSIVINLFVSLALVKNMYKCTLHCYALKRSVLLLGSTYRYTDGSGRKLDGMDLPVESNLQPISNRAYPVKGEHWQPMIIDEPSPHKGIVMIAGGGVVGLVTGIAFALRGWHTTILEKSNPLPPLWKKSSEKSYDANDDDTTNCVEQEQNAGINKERYNSTIDIDEDDFNIWDDAHYKNTVQHNKTVSSSFASKVNNNTHNSNNHRSINACLRSEHVEEHKIQLSREQEEWRKELEESNIMSGKEKLRPVKINCMRYKLERPHYQFVDDNNNNSVYCVSIACSSQKCSGDDSKSKEVERRMSTSWPAFLELQYALLTRRGLDALESIGLALDKVRTVGVKVRGVIDHAGAFNNWLTWRLNEEHSFAINMLSIDLFALRQLLEQHARELPNNNLCIFHEHVVEMVHPLHQQLVIRPVAQSSMAKEYELEKEILSHSPLSSEEEESYMCVNSENGKQACNADRVLCNSSAITKSKEKELILEYEEQRQQEAKYSRKVIQETEKEHKNELQNSLTTINRIHDANVVQHKRCESSLTLSSLKWNAKYAPEAVQYDLLVCAEGVNSRLRDVLDVEGFAADDHFGVKWFLLRTSALSHEHIHRWLYKENPNSLPGLSFTRGQQCSSVNNIKKSPIEFHSRYSSSIQSSMCMAFPRIDGNDMFSVMVYMPSSILRSLSDTYILTHFLSDVLRHDALATLRSFTNHVSPCPTIFCENLHNSVGLPSAVMIGDAAHHCHPFWMQNLAMGLEDGLHLLTHVDAYSRHFYDAIRLFSAERGVDGDALRILTERCLFYEQRKHANPFIRFRNVYRNTLQMYVPVQYNNKHGTHSNARYSKSIESMLNGRGYTSYKFAEEQQLKHNSFWKMSRLYT